MDFLKSPSSNPPLLEGRLDEEFLEVFAELVSANPFLDCVTGGSEDTSIDASWKRPPDQAAIGCTGTVREGARAASLRAASNLLIKRVAVSEKGCSFVLGDVVSRPPCSLTRLCVPTVGARSVS